MLHAVNYRENCKGMDEEYHSFKRDGCWKPLLFKCELKRNNHLLNISVICKRIFCKDLFQTYKTQAKSRNTYIYISNVY